MKIQPAQQINFGYSNKLKTLWKKGLMPSVKYGFYGDKLTKETNARTPTATFTRW